MDALSEGMDEEPEQIPAWIRYMPKGLSKSQPVRLSGEPISSPVESPKSTCTMRRSANKFSTNIAFQKILVNREKRKLDVPVVKETSESMERRIKRKVSRGTSVTECEKLLSFSKL